ncbi:Variant surface glycoprotein [Trypanosoma congolense IL3000]|uniref:Variant surface glycoprotein n=1 Tax=Trypanosoma congolense (strain IL3000) TaxID=1068625 RepID=F9W7Q7_TRYCI|nr:Variant surface glycoprotein [Trypanosoma congolense IL3000]
MEIWVLKTVMVVMVVMGIHAVGEEIVLNTSHFGALCNITKAATKLWSAANGQAHFFDKMEKITQIIDGIFFGLNCEASSGGIWNFPQNFIGTNPKRSAICGSKDTSAHMPSASDSLASTILCLCTPTTEDKKELCGYPVDGHGKWSDSESEDVEELFKKVWGDWEDGMFVKNCIHYDTYGDFEGARKNLTAEVESLKITLEDEKGVILGQKRTTCGVSDVCANVNRNPAWLEKLEILIENTKITIPLMVIQEAPREKMPKSESTDTLLPIHEPTNINTHTSPTAREDHKKQESPKYPENQPEAKAQPEPDPARKATEIPRKREEDINPVSEANETSGCLLTSKKWLFLSLLPT